MSSTKIKICGLFRSEDIEYANVLKPDFVGFIIDFPKSHRSVSFDTAKELISKLDRDIKSVCVFVDSDIEYVVKFAEFCDVIQLHGHESNDYIENLRKKILNAEIWKAFKIRGQDDVQNAKNSVADMVVLDNGYGTGDAFDWGEIANFGGQFILAGGINTQNIDKAMAEFSPYALDLSSSVETDKVKDFNKIMQIINKVRNKNND